MSEKDSAKMSVTNADFRVPVWKAYKAEGMIENGNKMRDGVRNENEMISDDDIAV